MRMRMRIHRSEWKKKKRVFNFARKLLDWNQIENTINGEVQRKENRNAKWRIRRKERKETMRCYWIARRISGHGESKELFNCETKRVAAAAALYSAPASHKYFKLFASHSRFSMQTQRKKSVIIKYHWPVARSSIDRSPVSPYNLSIIRPISMRIAAENNECEPAVNV